MLGNERRRLFVFLLATAHFKEPLKGLLCVELFSQRRAEEMDYRIAETQMELEEILMRDKFEALLLYQYRWSIFSLIWIKEADGNCLYFVLVV